MLKLRAMFIICIPVVWGQIKTEKLKQEGVLFERVSDVLIHHDTWRIFAKLEMIDEQIIINHIEQAVDQTDKICQQFQSPEKETECKYWEEEIKRRTETLKSRVEGLRMFVQTNRPKRALINAVGKISKYLFGTMDADDADYIENKMRTLDDSNKKTLHLMEKQISITSSNFKNIQTEMGNLTETQKEFERRLQALEKHTQHFHDLVGDMMLIRLMLQITARLDKLQQSLNEQNEIITALKLQTLHPLLLSSEDLHTIYLEISNYEKEHHIAKDNQITSQLITVTTEMIDNELWIQIQVPLIEPQAYTMYHAYELPAKDNYGISYILDFESPYILNNSKIQNYIQLTEQNIKHQCKACETQSGTGLLVCKILQARTIGTSKSNCLINLFDGKEKEERSCKHKVVTNTDEMLVKLHQDNAWLYFFNHTQNLMAQCKGGIRQFKILGAGILTLIQDCRFSVNNYELPYVRNRNTTLKVHQIEYEDLPIPTSEVVQKWTNEVKTSGKVRIIQHSEFHQIMQKGLKDLEELRKEVAAEKNIPLSTKVQYHTNTLLIVIISLGLAFTVLRKWKNKNPQTIQETHPQEVVVLRHTVKETSSSSATPDNEIKEVSTQLDKQTELKPSKQIIRF